MASAGTGGSVPPNFLLTPQQQSLLFAALESNKAQPSSTHSASGINLSPSSFEGSPVQNDPKASFEPSPYIDQYNYEDLGDSSFDFSYVDDAPKMIGDLPGTARSDSATEADLIEKRSHPDDEDDDEAGDSKRHEGDDKMPKKPGRKPLMSEPSSKRKAQNRAAQRAFRERKEKHLKDLETKVDELTKASEAANNENAKLRAQVERMTSELDQYKQRMTFNNSTKSTPSSEKSHFGNPALSHLNDVNFQFNFPKFGVLPGPGNKQQARNKRETSMSQSISPQQAQSPAKSQTGNTTSQTSLQLQQDAQFKELLSKFTGVSTPSMSSSSARNGSGASVDSASYSAGGATSSPSSSSQSNAGASSSCGTSPEPFTQSPMGTKAVDTMTTIGEEQQQPSQQQPTSEPFAQFSNIDFSNNTNFDWLAQQQGGGFDPQLFGDYREPQENVLANPSFDDFFNDALDADFFTPYNMAASPNFNNPNMTDNNKTTQPQKSILEQIDAQKDDFNDMMVPTKEMSDCTVIRDKLQAHPKAKLGDFDVDGLCSELTKKAKCSGTGPVVAEHDFDTILKKYMGKDAEAECVANTLGIAVTRANATNGEAKP